MIRRLLEAGPVGEEELDMIKMFCYNSAAEFCNRPYSADKQSSVPHATGGVGALNAIGAAI